MLIVFFLFLFSPIYREDDKKKKHRGSQSQDYIKVENGDRSGSVVSEAGAPMSAPSRNGPKKRKSTDEGLNCGSGKRLNRGSESRAGSMTREPLNTTHTLADASPKTRHTPLSSENPPFFPSNTSDATASKCPGEPRGNHVKQLRENQLMVSQAQEMHGHGRTTSSMTDASPHSYPSSSPTTSVSGMPNNFVEHSSYALADSRHQRAANTSTPATPLDTPSMIPHPMGEDHRHPDLPGPPKLVHFVDTYFVNVYSQTYAFLHRPTFMQGLSSHLPVLLFSMCAVAARFSSFPEEEAFYAKRARELIMVNYDNYNLEVVQSMVHMGLHDFGSNNGHKAWMFAGMAVRMGAALNMNLENRKKSGPRDAISRECARRTYWSYYLMDVRFFLPLSLSPDISINWLTLGVCFFLPPPFFFFQNRGSTATELLDRSLRKIMIATSNYLATSHHSRMADLSRQNTSSGQILTTHVTLTGRNTWEQWPTLFVWLASGATS